jgi:hypothetical protein
MCETNGSEPVGGGGGWICIGKDLRISFSWVFGFDFGVDKEANFNLFAAIDDSGTRDEWRARLSTRALYVGVVRSIAVSDWALLRKAGLASEAEEVGCQWLEFKGAAAISRVFGPGRVIPPAAKDEASAALVERRALRGWNKFIFELGEDDASAGFSLELSPWTKGVPWASGLDENRDSKDVGGSRLRVCFRGVGRTGVPSVLLDGVPRASGLEENLVSNDVGKSSLKVRCLSIFGTAGLSRLLEGVPCACGSDEKRDSKDDRATSDVVSFRLASSSPMFGRVSRVWEAGKNGKSKEDVKDCRAGSVCCCCGRLETNLRFKGAEDVSSFSDGADDWTDLMWADMFALGDSSDCVCFKGDDTWARRLPNNLTPFSGDSSSMTPFQGCGALPRGKLPQAELVGASFWSLCIGSEFMSLIEYVLGSCEGMSSLGDEQSSWGRGRFEVRSIDTRRTGVSARMTVDSPSK